MSDLRNIDILLVEDNPYDAELTVRALRKRKLANRIHLAADGAEALDYIFGRGAFTNRSDFKHPKVIFLDLKLPKVSGLEVLAAIKSDPNTHSIPVVILTSSREDPDIKQAYSLGANSYVVKPVNFDDFTETLSELGFYWMAVNLSET
jgi:two-component system response regulator